MECPFERACNLTQSLSSAQNYELVRILQTFSVMFLNTLHTHMTIGSMDGRLHLFIL